MLLKYFRYFVTENKRFNSCFSTFYRKRGSDVDLCFWPIMCTYKKPESSSAQKQVPQVKTECGTNKLQYKGPLQIYQNHKQEQQKGVTRVLCLYKYVIYFLNCRRKIYNSEYCKWNDWSQQTCKVHFYQSLMCITFW